VEGNDHVLFAEIVAGAEGDFVLARNGGEFELGGGIANFQGHVFLRNEIVIEIATVRRD
jgi:hypothetical protein